MESQLPPETVQTTLLELVRTPRVDLRVAVEKYLRTAAEGLDVERAGLWYFSPDKQAITEVYRFEITGQHFSEPGTCVEAKDYPRYFKALVTGGIVAASDAFNDLRTSEFTETYLKPQRIPSLLDVPIWRSGEMAGILCLEPVGEKRTWTQEEQLFAGGVAAMITLAIEVDARRQAEQAARASEAELRATLDQLVDIVTIVDKTGRIRYLNKAGRSLACLPDQADVPTREQLHALAAARSPEGIPFRPADTPISRALGGAAVLDAVMVYTDPRNGAKMVTRTNATPILDAAGKVAGAVAITRDATAQAELDELKDQFLRVSAHELRTPVGIIKGYAQLMQNAIRDGKPIDASLVQAVLHGSDRLSRLVQDLLQAMQYQSNLRTMPIEYGMVDIQAVTDEAVRDISVAAQRHRFVQRNRVSDATVHGDANRLRQVLLILFDNAAKYSPEGSPVEVELRRDDGHVVVGVSDSGIGVPAEKRDRIFDIFYRAHTDTPNDFGGLGVGLYLARQIVQRHGGEIGYTPRQPGSTFWVRLPFKLLPSNFELQSSVSSPASLR